MSSTLRPEFVLAMRVGQKSAKYVAAFAMQEWSDRGWRPGLYRIKTGGASWNEAGAAWWRRPGETYSFLDLSGVHALFQDMVRQALGLPDEPRGNWPPAIRKGDRIRVIRRGPGLFVVKGEQQDAPPAPKGEAPHEHAVLTFAASDPFPDDALQWGIQAVGLGVVMCRDVEVVR